MLVPDAVRVQFFNQRPDQMLRSRSLMLIPEGFQLGAYKSVFQDTRIYTGYMNTLFYVVVGTAINLLMTSLAAYGLSRGDLMGRKTLMKLITFTMFFGGGMIPTFLLIQNLGMVDTRFALIIPGAISTFYFLIMKTNFEGIPISLIESAKLDGANDFLILFRIVLPLSKPILAVMMLYYAVDHWNDYVGPMLYLRSQELYPIQIIMRDILISSSTEAMGAGAYTYFCHWGEHQICDYYYLHAADYAGISVHPTLFCSGRSNRCCETIKNVIYGGELREKRMGSILLSSLLTISLLAGCTGDNEPGTAEPAEGTEPAVQALTEIPLPITSEPFTIDYWRANDAKLTASLNNFGDMAAYKEKEKLTGIKVKFTHPPLDNSVTSSIC